MVMTAPAHKLVEFVCKGMMFRGEVRCVCACGFSTVWAPDSQQAASCTRSMRRKAMPMKFPTGTNAGDFDPAPSGTHIAVCDIVAYLGMQPGSGLYPKPKPQLYIRFELPN